MENNPPSFGGWMMSLPGTGGRLRSLPMRCRSFRGSMTTSPAPITQAQAKADAGYFAAKCGRAVEATEARAIEAAFLKAYRWQYVHSGARHPQFGKVLSSLITESQGQRIQAALATLQ